MKLHELQLTFLSRDKRFLTQLGRTPLPRTEPVSAVKPKRIPETHDPWHYLTLDWPAADMPRTEIAEEIIDFLRRALAGLVASRHAVKDEEIGIVFKLRARVITIQITTGALGDGKALIEATLLQLHDNPQRKQADKTKERPRSPLRRPASVART